jgi:hypothetical protein
VILTRASVFAYRLIDWMDEEPTSWSSVLLQELQRFAIWSFFAPSPQGKQIALKREIKRLCAVHQTQALLRTKCLPAQDCIGANHAGNVATRRSHTGILIFVNRAPVPWFSKKQNAVESSTFGSEFVALRIATEQIKALQHKLRMFGVPLAGPASAFCDNQGAVKNTSVPESALHKKHNATNHHVIGEAAAMGTLRAGKEDTATDSADGFAKVQPAPRRKELFSCAARQVEVEAMR